MITALDLVVAAALAFLVAYIARRFVIGGTDFDKIDEYEGSGSAVPEEQDIVQKLRKNDKNAVVFYGSQTGTAEDLAWKLHKELSARFGLRAMTADPEEFEFTNLDTVPEDVLVIFMMASYGEGEPTDNAAEFWQFLFDDAVEFSKGESVDPLVNLHYAVFGLGNSTYEKYNFVGRQLDKRLAELGAQRITRYGEGDDGLDTMEEDYLSWREDLFTSLTNDRGLTEREYQYEPLVQIVCRPELSPDDDSVYLGEPNARHLDNTAAAPWSHTNPYNARVKSAKEMFSDPERHCVHIEFDLSESNLKYLTGDHLAFWCQNSNEAVDKFLQMMGLSDRRHEVIELKTLDETVQLRVPSPTTYDAVLRYYLEINGPVSRQLLTYLAAFAPDSNGAAKLKELGSSKELFLEKVSSRCLTLAHLLLDISGGRPWDSIPFSFVVESIPHMQPRYYSIASSAVEDPSIVAITGVVERVRPSDDDYELYGVATNEMLDILQAVQSGKPEAYALAGPRHKLMQGNLLRVPIHIRSSTFKLPTKASRPIIMVGPGTGVAPFRGFIRERATRAREGVAVGKALLFFGSRNRHEDFLFSQEWEELSDPSTAGVTEGPFDATNFLEVITAFSREQAHKIYVQHRIHEHAKLVNTLLEQGAYFYICGDASQMAREVVLMLTQVISEQRGVSLDEANKIVKRMRTRNLLQEDIW